MISVLMCNQYKDIDYLQVSHTLLPPRKIILCQCWQKSIIIHLIGKTFYFAYCKTINFGVLFILQNLVDVGKWAILNVILNYFLF